MQRIVIIGNAGAGKSILANKLSKTLNIPVYHLDKVFLRAEWRKISKPEMISAHEEIIRNDKWILDGNYFSLLERRLERADTIIMLDFSTPLCVWRIYKRAVLNTQYDFVPEGCRNRVSLTFLSWTLNYKRRTKKLRKEILPEYKSSKEVFIFKSSKEVNNFTESLKN
jgi:adenylate kinase family enzyme